MEKSIQLPNSRASSPDLSWSQIQETVLMLGLAIGQIEFSMRSGDESVGVLASSFMSMSTQVREIAKVTTQFDEGDTRAQAISDDCESIAAQMQQVIVALQFYDRLSQRLSHVSQSIGALANLVADQSRLFNPAEWVKLQGLIKSKYTVEEERILFNAIMDSGNIEDAIAKASKALESLNDEMDEEEDDFELF